jgi:hypothetical protein
VADWFYTTQERHVRIIGADHRHRLYQILLELIERLQQVGETADPITEYAAGQVVPQRQVDIAE